MRIAFDIDGTIDSDPGFFAQLMRHMTQRGDFVVVLTGRGSYDGRIVQLQGYNIWPGRDYRRLAIVDNGNLVPLELAQVKANWCLQEDIKWIVDDTQEIIDACVRAGLQGIKWPGAREELEAWLDRA